MNYAHCVMDSSNLHGTRTASKHKNVKISVDLDNGNIVKMGALAAGEMEAFEAEMPAADTPLTELVILKAPEVEKDQRLKSLGDFYNRAGKIVRGYMLESGDQFRLTKEGLNGTPAVGSIVEADAAYKLKVVASATAGSTQIGKIIAVEGDYFVVAV